MVDPLPTLQRIFGFPGFRGVQADVVARVLARERDAAREADLRAAGAIR